MLGNSSQQLKMLLTTHRLIYQMSKNRIVIDLDLNSPVIYLPYAMPLTVSTIILY